MKNNQTLLAGGLLVILALIYYVTQTGTVDTKTIDPDLFKLDQNKIASIQVNMPTESFHFLNQNENWLLEDYPVDTLRMNQFLEQMAALTVDRKITSKTDKHARYELDDQGTTIILTDQAGTDMLNIILGKQGANYRETFVRKVGSDDVYAINSNLASIKMMEAKNFWDRTITDLSVEEITEVNLSGNLNYKLHRESYGWTYNGEPVDLEKVTTMLKPLGNLRGSNFAEEITAENPLYQSLNIILESGKEIDLSFHIKSEEAPTLLVKASDRAKILEYSKASLNRFNQELKDLQADPIPEG